MDTFFNRKDFALCDVPVPKGYPQSQTHAGIAVSGGHVYLTCSPYPAKKPGFWEIQYRRVFHFITGRLPKRFIDSEAYENPLLYKADECGESPTRFKLLSPAPLMERPDMSSSLLTVFNSDPEIFIEGDNIYILNRSYFRYTDKQKKVVISLIKGTTKNGYTLDSIEPYMEANSELISPCIEKFNGKYVGTYLETGSALDGNTFSGLYLSISDTIEGLKDITSYKEIDVDTSIFLPWHMSLFTYSDKLYSVVTCVKKGQKGKLYQLLGVFDESLSSLKIYRKPLTDYNSYRGAAYVTESGKFVLYSTTLREKVNNSKSIDGRDIINASCDFSNLITQLNK